MPNLKEKSLQVLKSLLRFKNLQLMSISKNKECYLKNLKEVNILENEIYLLKKELKERGI